VLAAGDRTAENIVRKVVDTYLEPNKTFLEVQHLLRHDVIDPLCDFSEACRKELQVFDSSPR
jgi:hypothetical protein